MPVLVKKEPVKTLTRLLHCTLVNEVTGKKNLKQGRHLE